MNNVQDMEQTALCSLRTGLVEGRALDIIEIALLYTFLGDEGEEEQNIFRRIKTRSKLGTLKDEPAIHDVIRIIDHRLSGKSDVVQLNCKTPKTLLYGNCINAIIQGASGEDHIVEVITDATSIVTNDAKILSIQEQMTQQYPGIPINGLQCLMDSGNTDLIHRVINMTLATDKYKADANFSSVQDFLDSIETDTGFVVKSDGYTVVVYSRGEDMVVKTTRSTDKTFRDADPTIFDLIFR